jgi:hypothetical protein
MTSRAPRVELERVKDSQREQDERIDSMLDVMESMRKKIEELENDR